VAALALGRAVPLYPGPGAAQPARSLPNPTVEQVPLAFLVRQSQSGWVQVQVPTRPNGATAWVRASDVQLAPVPTTIVIELGLHRLTAFQGDRVVLSEPVADGTNHTPTPTGDFFVDAKVKVNNPNGPYGPWQLSVAAFSDVLRRFGGGNGQIAIHGTPGSWAMGQSVSHGCVRMTNAAITRLAGLAPVGTPVSIRP
jgi:lipoprotein-anchoring transpeptidase ErfK/SrfK